MVSHINTVSFSGIKTKNVDVQVHISSGLPSFAIVGLPDKAIAESKERIRSAMNSIGLSLPPSRITINLSPADLIKEGSHYDLAIALGLMVEMNIISQKDISNYVVLGELSLDGSLSPVAGILPAAMHATAVKKGIICPYDNGAEALWAGDLEIIPADNILNLINHFKNNNKIVPPEKKLEYLSNTNVTDISEIKGQKTAKRALEIAAAGNHNMLMSGPPGSGKSMLASCLIGITPLPTTEEILEISMIESISNNIEGGKIKNNRPFRDPHHSCSMASMIGGGRKAKPGEISLAHRGILFLDELPEFPRQVLDSLRQPIENGNVTISRAESHVTYPANFQLIAAMNPCKCGYLSDAARACNKAPRCAVDYQSKISGPLFDRIDIHVDVPAVTPFDIYNSKEEESSKVVLQRVTKARQMQARRYQKYDVISNAEANGDVLMNTCELEKPARDTLDKAFTKMNLSMRGYNRMIKVARTIADLNGSFPIKDIHIKEALSYRKV